MNTIKIQPIRRAVVLAAGVAAAWLSHGEVSVAQYVYAPVPTSGPHQSTDWQGGFNLGAAASGTYSTYFIATDWAITAGDQWSSEARAALHGGPLAADPGASFMGPFDSGTIYAATVNRAFTSLSSTVSRTNMFWTGTLSEPYVANGSTPLYLSTRQSYASADPLLDTATWSNIRVVLDPVINETTLTTGAPVPTVTTNLGTLAVGATGLSLSVSNTATGAAGISWYRFSVDSPVDASNAFDFYTTVGAETVDSVLSLFADSADGLLPVASTDGSGFSVQYGLSFGSADSSQFQRLSYQVPDPAPFDGRGGTIPLTGFDAADGYYSDIPGAARLSPGTDYYLAVARYPGGFIDVVTSGSVTIGGGGTVDILNERFVDYVTPDTALGSGNLTLRIESQPLQPTLAWTANGSSPGGSGTWTTTGANWLSGSAAAAWNPGVRAVFSGSGGTVTVGPGIAVNAGLQFVADGITLVGAPLTFGGTTATANFIYVSDETGLQFASARIDAPLVGTAGFTKFGPGELVLGGSSNYAGGTFVSEGVLSIGAGGTTGFIGGDVTIGGYATLRVDRSDLVVLGGDIGGQGFFDAVGSGTVVLAGDVAPGSVGVVSAATLVIGTGGTTGSLSASANVAPDGRLVFNRSDAVTHAGRLSGSGIVVQFGSGTTTLPQANDSFYGRTVVVAGALAVADPLALGYYPQADVAAGATLDVSSLAGGFQFDYGGVLSGNGTVAGSVTIGGFGGVVSPGASPGTLTVTGNVTLAPNGNYNWQLFNATGTAGSATGWDLLSVGGVLEVTSGTDGPFNINLWSLAGVGPDVDGDAINWSATTSGTWRIASAAGGITGFAADKFVINVLPTNGTAGFTNDLAGGTFSLAQSGNHLNLVFTAGGSPTVITINVPSGTETQTDAGHPLLAGTTPVQKTGLGTVVFDQANTLTGPTTVSQGTLQLATASTLASSPVTVAAGATLAVGPQVAATVPVLVNNGLVDVGLGGLTVASGQTAGGIVAAIVAGRADGAWTGTNGITSSAAAAQSDRAVGWLDNGDGSFTVSFAAAGDLNVNGVVDFDDVLLFVSAGLFDTGLPATWIEGDYDYNGVVDFDDVLASVSAGLFDTGPYNEPVGGLAALGAGSFEAGFSGVAAVPEPATWVLGLLGLGIAAAARRRHASSIASSSHS